MIQRDPVCSQALSYKCTRSIALLGQYKHQNRQIQDFIRNELNELHNDFYSETYRSLQYLYAFGFTLIEVSFLGYQLVNLKPLNPLNIVKVVGSFGNPETIIYNNGRANYAYIPWSKCIHLTNSNIASLNTDTLFGYGDGQLALNYYRLKKGILTQLAIASKNNSMGLLHAKTPNNGGVVLLDSNGVPIKNPSDPSKVLEVTKHAYLAKKLQDINSKEFIVTDNDVDLNLLNIKTDIGFWQYVLQYIDIALQRCFSIPIGIFDTGGVNTGLSSNFGQSLDSTIQFVIKSYSKKLINKVIRAVIDYNFTKEESGGVYGEFEMNEISSPTEKTTMLNLLSSLAVSGLVDKFDPGVINVFNEKIGLPSLTELQLKELAINKANELKRKKREIKTEIDQFNIAKKTTALQLEQLDLQIQQIQLQKAQMEQALKQSQQTPPQQQQQQMPKEEEKNEETEGELEMQKKILKEKFQIEMELLKLKREKLDVERLKLEKAKRQLGEEK